MYHKNVGDYRNQHISDSFTLEDYEALVGDMYDGKITVSNDTTITPADNAKTITVNDQGNIKELIPCTGTV